MRHLRGRAAPATTAWATFLLALREVLDRWSCAGSLDDALRAWTAIRVDRAITGMIASVRASGIPLPPGVESRTLSRAAHVGRSRLPQCLRPSVPTRATWVVRSRITATSRAILDSLSLPSEAVLFIDDMEANVAAAARVGIHAELFAPETATDAVNEMQRILSRYGDRQSVARAAAPQASRSALDQQHGARRRGWGRLAPMIYLLQPFFASSNPSNKRAALAPASVSSRCGWPFSTV